MKSLFANPLGLLVCTFLVTSDRGQAQTIIDVTFPDGTGTNPTFLEIDNDLGGGTSTWTQSTGILSGNTTANSSIGAASETTVDFGALGDKSLVLTMEVASVTGSVIANGMFIGFQQRNMAGAGADLWNNNAPSFGVVIPGNAANNPGYAGSGAPLVLRRVAMGGSDPSNPSRYQFLPDFGVATAASIADGFGVTLTVHSGGWEVAITGLEDAAATAITGGTGAWGSGGINDWGEFNDEMRVGVSYQTGTSGGDLVISSITLVNGAPSPDKPFQILTLVHDPDATDPTVTLRWSSKPSASYAVDFSLDLETWTEINDSVPSGGEETEFVHHFLPSNAELVAAPMLYYRVRTGGG
jgi:hypothetical protein